jgi:hypothetical protein
MIPSATIDIFYDPVSGLAETRNEVASLANLPAGVTATAVNLVIHSLYDGVLATTTLTPTNTSGTATAIYLFNAATLGLGGFLLVFQFVLSNGLSILDVIQVNVRPVVTAVQ